MGIGIALGVAGIASSVGSAIATGNAAKRAAESQKKAAEKSGAAGSEFTQNQLGLLKGLSKQQQQDLNRFANSFIRTDSPSEFLDEAIDINKQGFDFRDDLKKSNLEFILGDSFKNLRSAQGDFTNLAAGDFSAFKRELNSSLAKAGAESFGSPVGTTFNIAARDRFNFRTAGLNEALKIGDFFATQGTVDPPDPIPSAFALADFQQRENSRFQDFNTALLGASTSVSGANFDRGSRASTVGLLAETNSLAAIGQLGGVNEAATASTLSGLSQAFTTGSNQISDRQIAKQNQANLSEFLKSIGQNRSANQVSSNGGAGFGFSASARPAGL